MSWFDKFFKKRPKKIGLADSITGYTPIFSQFGTNIYASDVVQQALNCIVMEMKKLRPTHVRESDVDSTSVESSIQTVLSNPNEFMTTADFIEKIMWSLLLNYNAFIVPVYDVRKDKNGNEQRKYTALYPIQPTNVNFLKDPTGTMYIEFIFANNYRTTLKYSDVIHIKKNYSVNDYMGGDATGQPNNDALLDTLNLNHQLLQGIAKAMKASFSINGVVKFNSMLDGGKTEKALKELEAKLKKSESGFLPLDIKAEYIPMDRKIQLVDDPTLKFIDEKILRNWGVPHCILTGDYTKSQYEAFYQKTLEPYVITISQAFTKTLFTDRERSYGNKILFYPKDLVFMSVAETLEMIRLLGDSGAMYENEKRVAMGMRPLPELQGVRKMSLNYVDAENANKYQMQKEV
nr:MAG TPA: portal protein [Caudoviricetes sp.]